MNPAPRKSAARNGRARPRHWRWAKAAACLASAALGSPMACLAGSGVQPSPLQGNGAPSPAPEAPAPPCAGGDAATDAGTGARVVHPQPGAAGSTGFERHLKLQGIGFHVSAGNRGLPNLLRVAPQGLRIDNSVMERALEGQVLGAEVADLDGDGSPEVYVFVSAGASAGQGPVLGFAANRRRSLSDIHLPAFAPGAAAARGYCGHDEFAVHGRSLVRRFPIFRPGDSAARPTGGVRQLHYQLVRGEAAWLLRLQRFNDL